MMKERGGREQEQLASRDQGRPVIHLRSSEKQNKKKI